MRGLGNGLMWPIAIVAMAIGAGSAIGQSFVPCSGDICSSPSTARVGIGTSPSVALQVASVGGTNGTIKIDGTSGASSSGIFIFNSQSGLDTDRATFSTNAYYDGTIWNFVNASKKSWLLQLRQQEDDFVVNRAPSGNAFLPLFRVRGDGKVGIGTGTSANVQSLSLEVKAAAAGAPETGNEQGIVRLSQGSGTGVVDLGFGGNGGYGWIQATDSGHPEYGYGLAINPSVGTNNGGNVGIGKAPSASYRLDVNGTIHGTNVIATYQDVAEWVPATAAMTPGAVVVLNPDKNNEVMLSSRPYDTAVAGVVSAHPGIVLGEASSSSEMIATTGRVKVHVTASNGAIRVGDLLVTAERPGTAMRSQPLEVAGVKLHRPGTLIGKALEPLPSGEGEILVLLSLQ